jgi:hypothetical protein
MLKWVRALPILLLAWVLSACGQTTPSPTPAPSGPVQPVTGTGWTLLRAVSPTPVNEGIGIAPLGADQYLVSITVPGGGVDGCAAPTFVGFDAVGTTLVARIVRSPTSDSCAVDSAVTYYVAVDRAIVPGTVDRVAMNEPCEGPACTAAVPRPS